VIAKVARKLRLANRLRACGRGPRDHHRIVFPHSLAVRYRQFEHGDTARSVARSRTGWCARRRRARPHRIEDNSAQRALAARVQLAVGIERRAMRRNDGPTASVRQYPVRPSIQREPMRLSAVKKRYPPA